MNAFVAEEAGAIATRAGAVQVRPPSGDDATMMSFAVQFGRKRQSCHDA